MRTAARPRARACAAVHQRLVAARERGAAVVLISEDLDEILSLSDRIGVMTRGAVVAEFERPADRQAIGRAMTSTAGAVHASPPPGRRFGRITLDVRQHLPAWRQALIVGAFLTVGLAISVGILAWAGIAPVTLGSELAAVLTAESLRGVLVQTAPLVLVGLGASLAFRIGFWNLGIEGQMIFGGIFAAAISIYDIGPPTTRLLLMGVAAAIGGALWVLLVVFLKNRYRVNEIIATLLLNYVAMYFLFHLLYGVWQDSKTAFPQSTPFRPFERLGDLGYGINGGLVIAIVGVVLALLARDTRLRQR
eukprot:gene30404-40393_t